MANAGLLQWANDIRFAMANDPGRQLFQEQVHNRGFLYLSAYLDELASGKMQTNASLIDLVKTPGRKRASPKKAKTTSRLQNVSCWEDDNNKENVSLSPSRNLQKSFLAAKDEEQHEHRPVLLKPSNNPFIVEEFSLEGSPFLPLSNTVSKPEISVPDIKIDHRDTDAAPTETCSPSFHMQAELSVIAEDDEQADKSRASIPSRLSSQTVDRFKTSIRSPLASLPVHTEEAEGLHINTSAEIHTIPSVDTFESIPLHTPTMEPASPSPSPRRVQSPRPFMNHMPNIPLEQISISPEPVVTILDEDYDDDTHRSSNTQVMTSHPSTNDGTSVEDMSMALHDVEEDDPLDTKKQTEFPSLPGPVPFRKSMREASLAPSASIRTSMAMAAAVTPAPHTGGTRTSWLKKAREMKALDTTTRKPSNTQHPSQSSKRKSDVFPEPSQEHTTEPDQHISKVAKSTKQDVKSQETEQMEVTEEVVLEEDGILDLLRRTVDGFGAHSGKSMGKSLGGTATANAIAEARKAAEARLAQREGTTTVLDVTMGSEAASFSEQKFMPSSKAEGRERILEIEPKRSSRSELVETSFQGDLSISELVTSKEDSLPNPREKHSEHKAPVFTKAPVFVPPVPSDKNQAQTYGLRFSPSPPHTFAPVSLGLGPRFPSPPHGLKNALSAQSSLDTVASSSIFDSQGTSAWLPSTQDTEYSQPADLQKLDDDNDGEESWMADENVPDDIKWSLGFGQQDATENITWSTTGSRKLPGPLEQEEEDNKVRPASPAIPGAFRRTESVPHDYDADADMDDNDHDAVDMVADSGKPTISLVEPQPARSQSQLSMASSASSQQPQGFFGHATKLMNSVLGPSKASTAKPKSIQLAAAAAKREQEEKDKKAAVMKNMENRRQMAVLRKAEEEKARALDLERKLKEEVDRRKREREEMTDKRPLKAAPKKQEEDTTKKRKLNAEQPAEKKPELKKPTAKSSFKPASKTPHQTASSSNLHASTAETKTTKLPSSVTKSNMKPAPPQPSRADDDEVTHPSQMLHAQMQARAKAQLEAAGVIPSEQIELPEINSEYGDSDDEDRFGYELPQWANSPEFRRALLDQANINPDSVFGAIRPLRMEDMFRGRQGRFRARTSSANWSGTDRLTAEEEREYARRMGFQS